MINKNDKQKQEAIKWLSNEIEKYYIQMYKDLGYTVLNTTKGGELGKHDSKWNYETIKNAVNTIKTRTEFHKTYPGAANVASKKGWLEELLKPLPNKNEPEINFFGHLYTISEISKQLNISRKKLYQRYKSGKRNFDFVTIIKVLLNQKILYVFQH